MKPRPHEDPACRCKACAEYDNPESGVTGLWLGWLASGHSLDRWGEILGLKRLDGEPDDVFRARQAAYIVFGAKETVQ